jgi:formiminoglutamase
MSDPHWPSAGEWIAGGHTRDPEYRLSLIGAPLHKSSISVSRADLAPDAIRAALNRFSLFDPTLSGDLRDLAVVDAGDIPLAESTPEEAFTPLSEKIRVLEADSDVVVILGGDNSVTRPGVHGAHALDKCGLITLDAHFDLRELDDGLSNGNPIRALLEDGLPGSNITQIGIQPFANSPVHAEVAAKEGINVVTREDVKRRGIGAVLEDELSKLAAKTDALYVDFDIDVLDRTFAPATPGARPGGLMPTELLEAAAICGAHKAVVAADIVEVSPPDDIKDVTVMVAAKVLLSFASGVASRLNRENV